jgi:zinc protease
MKNTMFSKFFRISIFIVSLLIPLDAEAQTASPKLQSKVQTPLISEFEVNGLKVIVKHRAGIATVSAGMFVRGGVRELTPQTAGLENLTLLTAIEASKKFPRQTLRKELSRTGSMLNVNTTKDFSLILLSCTKEHFDKSWEIFADVIVNPAFNPEDFSLVRERVLTILRNQTISPDIFLDVLQRRFIYANHPYSNDPLGTVENLKRFKLEDVQAYHQKILQTSRLLLVVVGDIEKKDIQQKVENYFSKLPKGDYKQAPLPALNFERSTVDIAERTLPTNYVRGVFAAPPPSDPDYYAMRVAIALLQSRVNQEVRIKRQLSYAPDASMNDNEANTAYIYVTATDANQAIKVMLEEIKKMRQQPPDEDSFIGLPGFFLTLYYIHLETNVAQIIELGRYELIGGGWKNSFHFLDKIRQVKPKDVQKVAEKYMKNIRFIVVGNPSAINKEIFLGQE